MSNSILINHCDIVKEASFLQKNGFVLIQDGMIQKSGPMSENKGLSADIEIDGTNKLLIPGLINGHNHSPMTLFRGMADDLDLADWLHNHIFPAEAAHVSEEMVYWCSKLAAAEMLLSGTTCVADGYFHSDKSAEAFDEAGIRSVVAHGILDFPMPGIPDPADVFDRVSQYIHRWKGKSKRVTPAVFAHSPYTCSPETLTRAKAIADENGVRFFIHLAETKSEKDNIIAPAGPTPLQHLNNIGLLDGNCVLVHAVWLNDDDLTILADTGAHVILCPQSNFKLASGQSRAVEMLERGISFGLGTDSCASNNSLDMFLEMDLLAKSQKGFALDPTVIPAEKVFRAATAKNNRILGYTADNDIKQGAKADLVLIDLNTPHLSPFYNQDLLVYSVRGNDVDSVIVDGRLVVKDKTLLTMDLAEVMTKVRELARPLGAMR